MATALRSAIVAVHAPTAEALWTKKVSGPTVRQASWRGPPPQVETSVVRMAR